MSWADVKAALDGRELKQRMLFNMPGTGAAWDTPEDPTNAVAVECEKSGYWKRQGVSYPAAPFPMGQSVKAGVTEHLRLLDINKPPEMEWGGVYYSQSGMVAREIYRQTRPGMPYERHGKTLKVMVIFGPPCREKNVANGNKFAGWAMPAKDTRGISDDCFVDTPSYIYDFVNLGDIYAEVMDDDVGEDMTMIFKIVQDPLKGFGISSLADLTNVFKMPGPDQNIGNDTLVEQLQEMMVSPLREVPAAIMAIYNGLRFVVGQPWPTYPHTSYDVGPAITLLNQIGATVPVEV